VKQPFHLSQEAIDLFTAQTVIETGRYTNLAKNNQKKEKAERNKAYAKKYRKRTNDKFGRRPSNNS